MSSPTAVRRAQATASSTVQVTGLVKSYGRRPALAGVDLELVPGEVVGLLGPNGAGKTTLLRVLIGALRADSGRLCVLGRDPWREAEAVHRGIGYLPGDLRLPMRLTGAEVLRLYDGLRGGTGGAAAALAERLRLPLDVPVRAMSHGNRQKLGVVQAFMSGPRLLLLDEPTTALDPLAQETVDALVGEAVAAGATVLMSSHALGAVERVADRVVLLQAGRVLAVERLTDIQRAAPRQVTLQVRAGSPAASLRALPGVHGLKVQGDRLTFSATAESLDAVVRVLSSCSLVDVAIEPADLDLLFRSYYEGAPGAR